MNSHIKKTNLVPGDMFHFKRNCISGVLYDGEKHGQYRLSSPKEIAYVIAIHEHFKNDIVYYKIIYLINDSLCDMVLTTESYHAQDGYQDRDIKKIS